MPTQPIQTPPLVRLVRYRWTLLPPATLLFCLALSVTLWNQSNTPRTTAQPSMSQASEDQQIPIWIASPSPLQPMLDPTSAME